MILPYRISLSGYISLIERIHITYKQKTLSYICFLSLGVSSLTAWNSWITVPSYFESRLNGSQFSNNFMNYFSLAFMGINATLLGYFVTYSDTYSVRARIYFGLIMLSFIFTLAAMMTHFDIEPNTFFVLTFILIVFSGIANSMLSAVFALMASYQSLYTQAATFGQGISGAIPSVVQIILKIFFSGTDEDTINSHAFLYFVVSLLTISLAFLCYVILETIPKESVSDHNEEETLLPAEIQVYDTSSRGELLPINYSLLYKEIMPFAFSVFFNFCLTLSLFPSITIHILPVDTIISGASLFTPIHFLVFNLSDVLGRTLPVFSACFITSRRKIVVLTTLRACFVPLFLLCNIQFFYPNHHAISRNIPLVFGDEAFMIFLFLFGLSNGWFSSNALMLAPRYVSNSEMHAKKIGDVLAFALATGLILGSLMSFFMRFLLCRCNPFVS